MENANETKLNIFENKIFNNYSENVDKNGKFSEDDAGNKNENFDEHEDQGTYDECKSCGNYTNLCNGECWYCYRRDQHPFKNSKFAQITDLQNMFQEIEEKKRPDLSDDKYHFKSEIWSNLLYQIYLRKCVSMI